MPLMPAVCNNCGAVFNSGIMGDGALNATFVNCTAGPCPKCGGMGHIPDGTFNLMGNVIELLSGPQRTVDELKKFAEILNKAKREKYSSAQLDEELDKELPIFSSLMKKFPRETRMELYAIIGIILTLISLMMNRPSLFFEKTISKTEIHEITQVVINNSIVQMGSGNSVRTNQQAIRNKYGDSGEIGRSFRFKTATCSD